MRTASPPSGDQRTAWMTVTRRKVETGERRRETPRGAASMRRRSPRATGETPGDSRAPNAHDAPASRALVRHRLQHGRIKIFRKNAIESQMVEWHVGGVRALCRVHDEIG